MNTLEMLVMFLPALWLASIYFAPLWTVPLGVLYLIGRMLYLRGYVADPKKRGAGYALSILPTLALLLLAVIGCIPPADPVPLTKTHWRIAPCRCAASRPY